MEKEMLNVLKVKISTAKTTVDVYFLEGQKCLLCVCALLCHVGACLLNITKKYNINVFPYDICTQFCHTLH